MTPGEDSPPVGAEDRAPGVPSLPSQGPSCSDEGERELSELIDAIGGAARVVRWLPAMGRGPDGLPGKDLAARALTGLRGDTAASNTD